MTDKVKALFERTTQGIKPGLEIITAVLKALDNPHHRLAVIHVAGTNGKGSVCAMLESVLRASGFKTGLYTSPHLIDFSERFRVNGEPIPEKKLENYIHLLEITADQVAIESDQRPATFFEISTAIAFQYFSDEAVDIAIIETGMGGRWDATNIVIPLISVITHIDIDHTNFLGDTLGAIAAEKAGIIKPGRLVVSAPQSDVVMEVLKKEEEPVISSFEMVSVTSINRILNSDYRSFQRLKIETHSSNLPPINLPLLGECQRENCAVSVAVLELLGDLIDFEPEFKLGLESVEWGARFQTLGTDPLTILDGAHNPSAARALIKTLKENYPKYQVGFVLGFLDDKDTTKFLKVIKPLASKAWAIPIHAPRGLTAEDIEVQAQLVGIKTDSETVSKGLTAAHKWASAEPDRLICITGSLYLPEAIGESIFGTVREIRS